MDDIFAAAFYLTIIVGIGALVLRWVARNWSQESHRSISATQDRDSYQIFSEREGESPVIDRTQLRQITTRMRQEIWKTLESAIDTRTETQSRGAIDRNYRRDSKIRRIVFDYRYEVRQELHDDIGATRIGTPEHRELTDDMRELRKIVTKGRVPRSNHSSGVLLPTRPMPR